MLAPDVGRANPGYGPYHGFTRPGAGRRRPHVCVTAATLGSGTDIQLGCKTVTLHNNPVGTLATPTVTGNTATADRHRHRPEHHGRRSRSRPTATASTPRGVMTDPTSHAYRLPVPVAEGSHSLCVYALNLGAGANTALGCRTVVVRNNPFGAVDAAGQTPTGVQRDRLGDRPQHHGRPHRPGLGRRHARRRHLRVGHRTPAWPPATRPRATTTASRSA